MKNRETPFLPLKQCAEASGISLYWWRMAVKNNLVPYFKSGNKFYVDYAAALAKIRDGEAG